MPVLLARRSRGSRFILGAGSLLLAGTVAGCAHAGASGAGGSSPKPNAYQAAVKYAQCMRGHGVDIPDPQTAGDGRGNVGFSIKVTPGPGDNPINPDSAQFKQAQEACKKLLPNGGELSPAQQAQARQNALKFARCMRDHGIDIPDPQANNGGLVIRRSGPGSPGDGGNVNPDDAKFQAAQKACQSLLGNPKSGGFNTVHGGGAGDGGGFGMQIGG